MEFARVKRLFLSFLVPLSFSVTAAAYRTQAASRQAQIRDVPSIGGFLTRAYQASVVLGDYLYIDGGEISFINGSGQVVDQPEYNTLSIDISRSWTNSSVTFNTIQKSAPVLNFASLWLDEARNEFYAFGGEQTRISPNGLPPVPPTQLWRFTAAGASGQWSRVTDVEGLDNIIRPGIGIGVSTANAGYLLGGRHDSTTSAETANISCCDSIPVPGILEFDFDSLSFANKSASGFSQYGTAQFGQGQEITGFGNHPVLAFFGGDASDLIRFNDDGTSLISFDTIHIYDPQAQSWHTQKTSGDTPNPRDRFCSVGIVGDEATYEIFIFGGHVSSSTGDPRTSSNSSHVAQNTALDEVFVLTIPGFNWQKANYTARYPRIVHSCNIIGNRQMIVIGGLNPTAQTLDQLLYAPDPWNNGIGIFDLSEMQWKDSYDANAKTYTSPTGVKTWYRQHGRYPTQWADSDLQAYFSKTSLTNSSSTSSSSPSPPSSSSDGSSSSKPSSGSGSNTGAIAGGVVGGVVGLILIVVLVWWLNRRHRHRVVDKGPENVATMDKPDEVLPGYYEAGITEGENTPDGRHEIGSSDRMYELEGSRRSH